MQHPGSCHSRHSLHSNTCLYSESLRRLSLYRTHSSGSVSRSSQSDVSVSINLLGLCIPLTRFPSVHQFCTRCVGTHTARPSITFISFHIRLNSRRSIKQSGNMSEALEMQSTLRPAYSRRGEAMSQPRVNLGQLVSATQHCAQQSRLILLRRNRRSIREGLGHAFASQQQTLL